MESEYIARAARGDAEAFETLITAYEKKIYCLCLRMMGNPHDGEDAAQEAMLRIWQKMSQYRGECAFSTWVYRVASSSCMDAIRKRSRQTQPSLEDLLRTYAPDCPVTELCPQTARLYGRFRRVTFQREGVLTDEALAERLNRREQVLCIVNSRKAAQSVYTLLAPEGSFHLSTLMVPAQRQSVLAEIRRRLQAGLPCRVVSTSLIEAGVDVDFPAVYREMAGLDAVLQAAGRCNREGKRPAGESIVTVFERTDPPPRLFSTAVAAAKEALEKGRDPGAPETMTRYFQSLRDLTGSGDALDRQQIISAFEKGIEGCGLPFRTVAEKFHLMDADTRTVYIPYGRGAALLAELQTTGGSRKLYRELGRYAVSVYDQHFQALYTAGALLTAHDVPALDENSAILNEPSLYSETMGLSLEPESGQAKFV